jgi:hypothetical protein
MGNILRQVWPTRCPTNIYSHYRKNRLTNRKTRNRVKRIIGGTFRRQRQTGLCKQDNVRADEASAGEGGGECLGY